MNKPTREEIRIARRLRLAELIREGLYAREKKLILTVIILRGLKPY